MAVESKADQSPVTIADRGAERLIRETIEAKYPSEAILGDEEGGEHSTSDRWVIDPIDGPKSFVAGVPLYATLLSYEVDFKPVVAVCYFPALDELLYAEVGSGAFWNGRVCNVSTRPTLDGSIICVAGHKSQSKYNRTAGVERLADRALATRTWCDAYGHSLVATGRVDAMLDPISARWDISAMHLIINEAGGRTSNYAGESPLNSVHASGDYELVSSNGLLHEEILSCFR